MGRGLSCSLGCGTGAKKQMRPLQARLREWASHSPSTALTHPLSPPLQLSVLESALGLDKPFPLHMSEQTKRGIPDCSWPREHRVYADSPVEEPCPLLPPPSPCKLTFLHPAQLIGNAGVPPPFPSSVDPRPGCRTGERGQRAVCSPADSWSLQPAQPWSDTCDPVLGPELVAGQPEPIVVGGYAYLHG